MSIGNRLKESLIEYVLAILWPFQHHFHNGFWCWVSLSASLRELAFFRTVGQVGTREPTGTSKALAECTSPSRFGEKDWEHASKGSSPESPAGRTRRCTQIPRWVSAQNNAQDFNFLSSNRSARALYRRGEPISATVWLSSVNHTNQILQDEKTGVQFV